MEYTAGTDVHRLRLHVAPFNYPAATQFNYNPTVGGGTEVDVMDTFSNFGGVWAPLYKTTDSIALLSVFQIVAGVPVERFGWAQPSPVSGSSTGTVAADQRRAAFISYNFKSALGGRAKVVFLGPIQSAGDAIEARIPIDALSGDLDAIATYLESADCGAVCHDGNKFADAGRVTFGFNKKLRRNYNFA